MATICPTITAYEPHEYRAQMERIEPFATRVHIDLMDGEFAPTKSPPLEAIWWPHELTADIHLMYQRPMDYLEQLIRLKPNLVIIHNEAEVHHMDFAAKLHAAGIKTGLAILRDTPIEYAYQIMHSFDHVLVFSGNLGHHGGEADLGLLDKVRKIREHHPDAEIGWDGGINDQNAKQLVEGGVDVLNVGGFIQKADDPLMRYRLLDGRASTDSAK
ncbi:MAG: rpe [Candidatus Saccharibacteria bacterium]|nr:rpe [Candidatus Saccharibacteria bacterium]